VDREDLPLLRSIPRHVVAANGPLAVELPVPRGGKGTIAQPLEQALVLSRHVVEPGTLGRRLADDVDMVANPFLRLFVKSRSMRIGLSAT